MTASQFVRLLPRAKRIGTGKWVSLCPVHRERSPSLNIREGKSGVLVHCFGCGAGAKQVAQALGIEVSDLFYAKRSMTPELRQVLSDREMREKVEKQLGLVIWLGAVEKGKKAYWAAAERRIRTDIEQVRCRLEPGKIIHEFKMRQFRKRVASEGLDKLMEEVWKSQHK